MAEGGQHLNLLPDQHIVKQGWLSKRGEYIRNWRQRYFYLLDDGMLLGFKTMPAEDLSNPLNNFTVKGCQTLKTEHPKPNTFIIRGLHWTTIIERTFNAQSKDDRDAWVKAIECVKDSLLDDDEEGGGLLASSSNGGEVGIDGDEGGEGSSDLDANTGFEYLPAPKGSVAGAVGPYRKKKNLTLESFELLSGLGKGTFGRVVLAREKLTGNIYAIKMLRKDVILEKDEVEHTLTENRVLQRIDHPFLMYLKYSFKTKDLLCFVLEYVMGGELFRHLTKEQIFTEERTKFYGAEICLALGYLHRNNIIYRDLKLENLLIDAEGHIKVADFGLCKENMSYGKTTKTFCGTPEYLAPEVLEENDYGRSVDWWGYGVCLYEMMLGRLPFFDHDHEKLFQKIVYEEARIPRTISAEARDLLRSLLVKNPNQRLGGGVQDALEVQEHAFYYCINWEHVYQKKVPPPFIPEVRSSTDTNNYDPEFTTPVHITPPSSQSNLIVIHEQDEPFSEFDKFSYQGTSSTISSSLTSSFNSPDVGKE